MSDYPSDAEIGLWVTEANSGGGPHAIVRHTIAWARANPAPQEPPTGHTFDDFNYFCERCGAFGPNTMPGEACPAPTADPADAPRPVSNVGCDWCAGSESDHERGCPKEPTEAPKPTSGDKPPHSEPRYTASRSKHDPRNPSPTPEPTREPDPWALPDGWRWVAVGTEWHVQNGDVRVWDNWQNTAALNLLRTGEGGRLQAIVARRNREDPPKGGETPSVRRDTSTPEGRAFLAPSERSHEVDGWPAWKRAGINE